MENLIHSAKRQRSCAYPAINLKEALDAAKKLYENIGPGPYSRDAAAKGLNYSSVSGASASRVAALAHFGLLSKKKGVYSQTPLCRQILLAADPQQKNAAIIQACQAPELYKNLIDRFDRQPLPKLLNDTLSRDFKINPHVAKDVAQAFKESLEFAALLKDGLLTIPAFSAADAENRVVPADPKSNSPAPVPGSISVDLPSGIKIIFPKPLALRVAMGDFAPEIQNLNKKAENN